MCAEAGAPQSSDEQQRNYQASNYDYRQHIKQKPCYLFALPCIINVLCPLSYISCLVD